MSKELEVNWKTKHKKFGEIHIKSINLDSNYMWTDNEEYSCIGADSIFAKELYPTIPMLMNKELKQALIELEELKEMFKLQSYHFVVEIKPTSYEKAKIYSEYQNEIKRYKELFYKFSRE